MRIHLKLFVSLLAGCLLWGCRGRVQEKVIKLGAVLPLTGPAAAPGNEMNNAVL